MKTIELRIVYNKKTGKIYPFDELPDGELAIKSSVPVNLDDLVVSLLPIDRIDFENNRVIEEKT